MAGMVAALAALIGGLYAVITVPLLSQIKEFREDVVKRLDRIEAKLEFHDQRITRLEERTSPLRH